jgi:hypothetical protein
MVCPSTVTLYVYKHSFGRKLKLVEKSKIPIDEGGEIYG